MASLASRVFTWADCFLAAPSRALILMAEFSCRVMISFWRAVVLEVLPDCCSLAAADHGEKVNGSHRAVADEQDE